MTHRTSVIIPTRNGAELLAECLEALRHQTYRDFETIVLDDASTDDTSEVLATYSEAKVVRLPGEEGHGFVAAINAGLAVSHGEVVALLNNDAVPDPDWLGALVDGLGRNAWAGMAASKLVLYDRPDTFHSTGDYYGLDGLPNSRGVWQTDVGQYDQEEEVFGPCAAAAAYRRSVLAEVAKAGGTRPAGRVFDPQLWMYLEDVDLTLRARLLGHRTVYVPSARVRHRLSATGGGVLASYYVGRNTVYVIVKDLPLRTIVRNLPRMAQAQARIALEALRNIRGPASRARLRGLIVGLLSWPRVLGTRRRVMGSKRLTVAEFERLLQGVSDIEESTLESVEKPLDS